MDTRIDTTIKLLYGHQAGAEISYNPRKPGRPSHTIHTYWIGKVRMVLDAEVQSGKAACGEAQPATPAHIACAFSAREAPTIGSGRLRVWQRDSNGGNGRSRSSRPLLPGGIARLTHHSAQSRLLVTITHVAGEQIKSMVANIRKGLDHVIQAAPQLPKLERWKLLVRYIVAKIIAAKSQDRPPRCTLPLGMAQFATG